MAGIVLDAPRVDADQCPVFAEYLKEDPEKRKYWEDGLEFIGGGECCWVVFTTFEAAVSYRNMMVKDPEYIVVREIQKLTKAEVIALAAAEGCTEIEIENENGQTIDIWEIN